MKNNLFLSYYMVKKNEIYYDREQYHKFHKIIETSIGHYAIDLLEYQKSTVKLSSIYIVVVQDIYSRLIGTKIIYDKEAKTTLDAYKYIIRKYFWKITPHKLSSDSGSEFKSVFNEYVEKQGTEHVLVLGEHLRDTARKLNASSIIERTNGTIRRRINDKVEEEDKPLNDDMLEEITNTLNNTKHTGIKEKPIDVFSGDKIPTIVIYKHNKTVRNSAPLHYNVNDHVRITLQFKKMSENSKRKTLNSKDVYKIVERKGHKYKLNNGSWFSYTRLVKTKKPITENPSNVFIPPKPKNNAPIIPQERQEKRMRQQPRGANALMAYNELWAGHHGYEMADIDMNANGVQTRNRRRNRY
jgi:hypothetical protein